MNIFLPESWYADRISTLQAQLDILNRKRRLLGWARFLSIGTAILLLIMLWPSGLLLAIPVFLILLTFFLFFVSRDLVNSEMISNLNLLVSICREELRILNHDFSSLPGGEQLEPVNHDYAGDLDIFGKASLYQYCNRTTSEQGNKCFANWLLEPASNTDIRERQAAVKELSGKPEWRQQLQAFGREDHITLATTTKIEGWINQKNIFIFSTLWKLSRILLPAISLGILFLHILGLLSASWFYSLLMLMFVLSLYISKLVMPHYSQLGRITAEMETLSHSIRHIENEDFQSALLSSLKNDFAGNQRKASSTIRDLKMILDRLDYRLNPLVFLPLNTFLFWDLHQVFALEKWREDNHTGLAKWSSALAAIEALCSLGNLHFNHPSWNFPELSDEERMFAGIDLGHPLIPPAQRVSSSLTITAPGQLALITGSNMAGKSTFLRNVGVNIVLAMAGGPVCASSFKLSNMKVMSSMRISDNLEESTSTFYAELKKLKQVIEAVNRKENVFLLLDEILRGTNSADRHAGSTALIRQLLLHNAVGLVATHDLELAKLEEYFPGRLNNYHFDVQVEGEELYFDYRLKEGICTSMNASLLMKKIGIEL